MRRASEVARRVLAEGRLRRLADLAPEHPARRAAVGRVAAYSGLVPQRDSSTVEAVAWRRESGADPGYLNRRHRRHEERRHAEG